MSNPIDKLKEELGFDKIKSCISLAKRDIIDNIYRSAKLEGIDTTFLDTERIYDGMDSYGFKVNEVITIVNLKHAWWFLLGTLEEEPNYNYICQMHKEVSERLYYPAGYIRKLPVRIGGTKWVPDMPVESVIKENLNDLLKIKDNTTRALEIMCYLMRSQIFIDGNKRTSILIANQILISTGTGILSIPIECIDDFKKLVINFYETNNNEELINFLKENCIQFI